MKKKYYKYKILIDNKNSTRAAHQARLVSNERSQYYTFFKDEKGEYCLDNRYCPRTDRRTIPLSIRPKKINHL